MYGFTLGCTMACSPVNSATRPHSRHSARIISPGPRSSTRQAYRGWIMVLIVLEMFHRLA